jgi:hypothetical protein
MNQQVRVDPPVPHHHLRGGGHGCPAARLPQADQLEQRLQGAAAAPACHLVSAQGGGGKRKIAHGTVPRPQAGVRRRLYRSSLRTSGSHAERSGGLCALGIRPRRVLQSPGRQPSSGLGRQTPRGDVGCRKPLGHRGAGHADCSELVSPCLRVCSRSVLVTGMAPDTTCGNGSWRSGTNSYYRAKATGRNSMNSLWLTIERIAVCARWSPMCVTADKPGRVCPARLWQ